MTIENLTLFQAMNAKMNYLAERQKVISQNVANADTPGYQSKDLSKIDFSKLVEGIDKSRVKVSMVVSRPGHILPPDQSPSGKPITNRTPYEVKPDGNSVNLEEQMVKASDVQLNYNLMLNLYRDAADMIRTSLGKKS